MIEIKIFALIFGLLWGSFANVLIYRIPRELSVIKPRSRCSTCQRTIPWYFNIPVLSFLFLRGKCGFCHTTFSWRYPFVELICGLASLLLMPDELTSLSLLKYLIYFFIFVTLIAHFFIDLDFQILPNSLNIFLLFLASLTLFINPDYSNALMGALLGFLFPLGVTYGFYKWRGQVGLGGGDIKLFGILGLLFGPLGILQNIFMSCFLGALIGLALILLKKLDKNKPFAFGPAIILVTFFQLYFPKFFAKIVFLP